MKVSSKSILLIVVMLALLTELNSIAFGSPQQVHETKITIATDRSTYYPGSTIVVTGTVPRVVENNTIFFRLYTPLGATARTDLINVHDNGTFRYEFPIGGPIMLEVGTYRIVVNYDNAEAEVSFGFTSETSDCWFTIVAEEYEFVVRCLVYGGSIRDIRAEPESRSLVISIVPTAELGSLSIELPYALIQSQNDTTGEDVPYHVSVDGEIANFSEILGSRDSRALKIPFDSDDSEIVISGTWVVPESGGVALLVSIIGILSGLILLSRRSSAGATSH